ncbi:MAG: Ig-like domain-containing protein [Candidatus Marinimicrobia bacterium]|nr:Ig-like domain-containing protein [Candidatus Neomarinimicrobiota bacterium]
MLPKLKQFPLILILLLFGCAAQGPATGGSVDKKGPVLISIHPQNGAQNISPDQKITFIFDELLDPVSIPASIQIESDLNYKLKIRGRKLVIIPEKEWPIDGIVRVNLSRKIRDYQKNMMDKPIQLIFSTGLDIPVGFIKGEIIGIDSEKLIEVGLYEWPPSAQSTYIQKVEVDEMGSFLFSGIENGRYTIVAIEGILSDVAKQMMKKNYAMLTSSYITISDDENEKNVAMLLSEPVEKLKITSVEMQSQYSCQLTLDDNNKELFIIDSFLSPGDSVFVNLEKSNRLETYQVPEYSFILPEIKDTLVPKLSQSFFENDKFNLIFSEPVILDSNAIITTEDSIIFPLPFTFENEYSIIIPDLPDSIKIFQILGDHIQDWSGNNFADSSKTVRITRHSEDEELLIGGNILGFVNYDDKYPLKIEAHQIGSESKYIVDVKNHKFELINLSPGFYELWGYETINTMNKEIYHSGLWEPYHRAAKFSFYPDTIDVRARWDVEGVNIIFE